METAAGRQATAAPLSAAQVCRTCAEPVTVVGPSTLDVSLRRAIHTATGEELAPGPGEDGSHLAAPIDADLVTAAAARKAGARS
jgi:hypothetical protein